MTKTDKMWSIGIRSGESDVKEKHDVIDLSDFWVRRYRTGDNYRLIQDTAESWHQFVVSLPAFLRTSSSIARKRS
jgi:hypothetical protein